MYSGLSGKESEKIRYAIRAGFAIIAPPRNAVSRYQAATKTGGLLVDKPTVFISYSHKDEIWKDRLLPQLKSLQQLDRIVVWDDRQIDAGDQWYPEIKEAMEKARVAICLISPNYLASDFCVKEEVPFLLHRCEKEGVILIPILIKPCLWELHEWISQTQMLPRDGKAISPDFKDEEDVVFVEVARTIVRKLANPAEKPTAPLPRWSPPEKLDIARLPVTGSDLFGRQKELMLLDEAWESAETNVISFVAWGGVGKSTLVNKWLERMAAENYRGARRVFAWSFYSQGTSERATSADLFINVALEWFGDENPTAGSPWDKGERLARLAREQKTLLILDGMEPLQSSFAHERGKVKDPALATLVSELARENDGLLIITTRETITDLEFEIRQENLEQISPEAGRALLRVGGVRGADEELERATEDFGRHALALNLLAVYLQDIPGHHISEAAKIPDLDIPEEEGKHPRRLIAAFEQKFGEGPEIEALRLLGLFDRPADGPSIAALRKAPAIAGLTDHIHESFEADWLRAVQRLRKCKLIAEESHHDPDELDAHPLVREHFGQQLRERLPDAWREANNRLYEHLTRTTKELPETVEEMSPLFAAIAHGCAAGRHQEALEDVYWRRIQRGPEHFNWRKLGAFGADLAALTGFFTAPWQQPVAGLMEAYQAFVLNEAGFDLSALGRLKEAVQSMRAGLAMRISQEEWGNAAQVATNLSQLYLTLGEVGQSRAFAQQGVELADRSGDSFRRTAFRTALADVLHQSGLLVEAEATFREAEALQKERQPAHPLLYSMAGFLYRDLLLGQGRLLEVRDRAAQTIEWEEGWLLDIALDNLSLGRASLRLAAGACDSAEAADFLQRAVNGLRQAGRQDYLPRGLLARAEMYRLMGDYPRAQSDLAEAQRIAERGEMGLHLCDCHLEWARLCLAQGDPTPAREHWATAKAMVERMGYHRRDREVEEIARELGETA
jgi:tetratricopeptide (TPR) repeat protein